MARSNAYVNLKRGGQMLLYSKCEKMCQNCTHQKGYTVHLYSTVMVLLTLQHHYNHRTNAFSYFELVIAPLVMVLLTLFHQ